MPIDTVRRVETPEGVELDLPLAGPVVRAQAWVVDTLIRGAISMGAGMVAFPFGALGRGFALLVMFGLTWVYPVLFEVLRRGATPGKAVMGLRVVHDNGTPVGWTASAVRNLIRAADFLPFGYAAGLLSCLLDTDFRRLGDLAAGTVVVYAEQPAPPIAATPAPPLRPPISLTVEDQRAVLAFAERTGSLTPERARELAALVPSLSGGGPDAAERLQGIAAWIAGRR
ncbi:MAG TPA: RDD family protein [Candidatus Polarisedimenticolaceae bacterium]|nr:RDD family protein [Candidatus Polarisedimenticolaceae bacterium]